MPYAHSNQYRAPITRSRQINDQDANLPFLASTVADAGNNTVDAFRSHFDNKFATFYPYAITSKAVANWRTEIACRLFGLYYEENNRIKTSPLAYRYLSANDNVQFFRDRLYRLQFPNLNSKSWRKQHSDGLNVHPIRRLLSIMREFSESDSGLTKSEIGYYILNNKDFLCGLDHDGAIRKQILKDRSKGIQRKVKGHNSSYPVQHITALIKYCEYANLIVGSPSEPDSYYVPNFKADKVINIFCDNDRNANLDFDLSQYDLDDKSDFLDTSWLLHNGEPSVYFDEFGTSVNEVGNLDDFGLASDDDVNSSLTLDAFSTGKLGEAIALKFERARIRSFDPSLVFRVNNVSNVTGMGCDIQSIRGKNPNPNYQIYIDAKTSVMTSEPTSLSLHGFNVTPSEYDLMQQQKENYWIYRVFVIPNVGHSMWSIENMFAKETSGVISIRPTNYKVDIKEDIGEKVL